MQTLKSTSTLSAHFGYIDILRIFSCILIIGVHVSAMNWEDTPVTSSQWQFMNFYDCLSLLGVPLFFMISGALFLNEHHNISLCDLFFRKILRLFICYHVWLLFYNSIPFFTGELSADFVTLKDELFLKTLLGKGIYHLWFIPELIILYILSPILKEAFHKKEICLYFLILFTITGALLPTLLEYDFPYRRIVNSYYERSSLVMLTGYLGYFVLGHYIHSFVPSQLSKRKKIGLFLMILLACFITISACSIDAITKGEPSSILNNPLMLPSFLACMGIFTLIKCHYSQKELNFSKLRPVTKLTFGIYLIHPFVINILRSFGISTLYPHPAIMIPVLIVIVLLLSAIPIYLISKIPVLNKWLI